MKALSSEPCDNGSRIVLLYYFLFVILKSDSLHLILDRNNTVLYYYFNTMKWRRRYELSKIK